MPVLFALLALPALLSTSDAQASHPAAEQPRACQGVDDACIDGYTSLLQESAHLLPNKAKTFAEESSSPARTKNGAPSATINLAESATKTSIVSNSASNPATNVLWTLLGVVLVGFVSYIFLVKPTLKCHQQMLERGPQKVHGTGKERNPTLIEAFVLTTQTDCPPDEVEYRMHDTLQDDTYSMAIAVLVRDMRALSSTSQPCLRVSRIIWAVGLIMLTVGLQAAILAGTKMYVTPQQVASIRDSYDEYEMAMYGEEHTYVIGKTGKHRGTDIAYFNASAFDDLDDDLKSDICNIPLSQLSFVSLVIFVWTVTCAADLKNSLETFMAVVIFTDTSETMEDALTEFEEEDDDDEEECGSDISDGIPIQVITSLTLPMKTFLSVTVFLPGVLTTAYVLWLGSRWLVATNDFGNLVSNAVALEFILAFKQLLYYALVSERNKRELKHTGLAPCWIVEPAGYGVYFNTASWAVFAIMWVWYYVHYQGVLPEYKWDVHSMCSPWLQSQLEG